MSFFWQKVWEGRGPALWTFRGLARPGEAPLILLQGSPTQDAPFTSRILSRKFSLVARVSLMRLAKISMDPQGWHAQKCDSLLLKISMSEIPVKIRPWQELNLNLIPSWRSDEEQTRRN